MRKLTFSKKEMIDVSGVFLRVFNVAVTAGWIVPACLLLRVILRGRLPGWVRCALWSVVGIRLLLPFSLESIFSLIPSAQTVPPTITTAPMPQVNVGVPPVDAVINPVISQTMAPKPQASVNPMQVVLSVGTVVWLVGVAVMLLVLLVNGWRLRRILQIRRLEEKGVYVCDGIPTAFVMGVLRPVIYIPSNLDPQDREYVLAHERMHIRRGDHIGKLLGTLLLAVYWFHPLLWVAYAMYSRDVEMACDEAVLNHFGEAHAAPYALALVNCVEQQMRAKKSSSASFGESDIKERVRHMMKYKKPKLWVTLASIALIAVTAICFLTSPVSAEEPNQPILPPNMQETTDPAEPGTEPTDPDVETTEPDVETTEPDVETTEPGAGDNTTPAIVPPGGAPSDDFIEDISEAYQQKTGYAWEYYCRTLSTAYGWRIMTNYYGMYGDCAVLYNVGNMTVQSHLVVEGYDFADGRGDIVIEVYRNGAICDIQEAYDNGWITNEQLRAIWKYHYSLRNGKDIENPS